MVGNNDSFDPKTWSPNPPAATAGRAPAVPSQGRQRAFDYRSPIAITAISTAILLAGGAFAIASRGEPEPAVIASPAAPASAPAASGTRRTLVLARAADLGGALRDAGVREADVAGATAAAMPALSLQAGEVRAILTLDGTALARLELASADGSSVIVQRGATGFDVSTAVAALDTRILTVRGEMDANNFYSSAVAAGVVDSLIPAFASALAFDFDFQREIRPGDVFEAAFAQTQDANGRPIGPPRLLFASIVTATKSRALYWFKGKGEAGWFDGNGVSTVRALMRTPVDGARVSSQFGMRQHPVLGFQKLHKGTDFAAPVGTPIFASGAASVEFAGEKGPNGNFIKLRHLNGWETLYLHLDRIDPAVSAGKTVAQGQTIGTVGTTGRSTGPHLHYEVHIDDVPVDPQAIEMESARQLAGAARTAFIVDRDRIDAARAAGSGT